MKWGAWLLRKVPVGRAVLRRVKDHTVHNLLNDLHGQIAHSIRELSVKLLNPDTFNERSCRESATALCTASAKIMNGLLEAKGPNQIHCCMKVFAPSKSPTELGVATFARSVPGDNRPLGTDDIHLIDKTNTVWCAILGRHDGEWDWRDRQVDVFACNDLRKHRRNFKCDRENWEEYYQSALVYPLRCSNPKTGEVDTYGFIAFDSAHAGAFPGLPDIFGYRDSGEGRTEYLDLLTKLYYFHFGAFIADTLGAVIRPFYENSPEQSMLLE